MRKQAKRVNHPAGGGTVRQQRTRRGEKARVALQATGAILMIAAGAALLVAFATIGPTLIP